MVSVAKDDYQAVMTKAFIEQTAMAENVKIVIYSRYTEEMDMHNLDNL